MRLFFGLLALDEFDEAESESLELPLEMFRFLPRLKSLGGGDEGFFRFGAGKGDGDFFL